MAIRVDAPGRLLVDFHTINPRPDRNGDLRFTVPLGALNKDGSARPWQTNNGIPTAITRRHYLTDATFLWLIHGNATQLDRLAHALHNPVWAISLGRRTCSPDAPFLLGEYPGSLLAAARSVPRIASTVSPTPLHILAGKAPAGSVPRTHDDRPLGSHPHDGYTRHTRHVSTVTPPVVPDRDTLLDWALDNLTDDVRSDA